MVLESISNQSYDQMVNKIKHFRVFILTYKHSFKCTHTFNCGNVRLNMPSCGATLAVCQNEPWLYSTPKIYNQEYWVFHMLTTLASICIFKNKSTISMHGKCPKGSEMWFKPWNIQATSAVSPQRPQSLSKTLMSHRLISALACTVHVHHMHTGKLQRTYALLKFCRSCMSQALDAITWKTLLAQISDY